MQIRIMGHVLDLPQLAATPAAALVGLPPRGAVLDYAKGLPHLLRYGAGIMHMSFGVGLSCCKLSGSL